MDSPINSFRSQKIGRLSCIVGLKNEYPKDEPSFYFEDDHELLAYLLYEEQMAEQCETVSYESCTSD